MKIRMVGPDTLGLIAVFMQVIGLPILCRFKNDGYPGIMLRQDK